MEFCLVIFIKQLVIIIRKLKMITFLFMTFNGLLNHKNTKIKYYTILYDKSFRSPIEH